MTSKPTARESETHQGDVSRAESALPAVGELLMLGFHGTEPPDWLRKFEAEFGLGGVILFDRDLERKSDLRNIESPKQVRRLCAEIHALPSRPLVFIDQEGGLVRRLKPTRGFCELPSAKALAKLPNDDARAVLEASFKEMASLGIDFDLAPVIDIDSNPDNPNIGAIERSFSGDAATVRRCTRLAADAARAAGLGLCLKHFPGLGGATTDSHTAVTDLTGLIDPEQIALFNESVADIPGHAILVSHGVVRDWDPDRPVSISPTGLAPLRDANPDALLISDDIQMQGFQAFASTREGSLLAIGAGLDLLCIGNNLRSEANECRLVAQDLRDHIARDAQFATRVDASIARVRARKSATS